MFVDVCECLWTFVNVCGFLLMFVQNFISDFLILVFYRIVL